jgi:uncharacterized protein YbaP (TraB family)
MALLVWGGQAGARCTGENLMTQMPKADLAAITARAHAEPFSQGLLWRAKRGTAQVVLAGTYHFDDARHETLVNKLIPELRQAAMLLVEAGPKEEARLQSEMATRADLMFDPDGPTLPEMLDESDWQRLSVALEARGIPPVFAAKFKPWYASILISMSPCAMSEIAGGATGLDKQLVAQAEAMNLPIRALEPYDTAFHLFDDVSETDQRDLLRGALSAEGQADDMTATLAEAYFAGETRLIWTFSEWLAREDDTLPPEVVEAQLKLSEDQLMVKRNRAWISVIEAASATAAGKPVVMAAGALHLAGEDGVLNLMRQRGWMIEPY